MKLETELYLLCREFYESEDNIERYKKMSGCTVQDSNHSNIENVQYNTTHKEDNT